MVSDTYASQKQKIEREIQKLQKQVDLIQSKRRKPTIESIIRSMREYDITPEEIAAAFTPKTRATKTTKPVITKKPSKPAPIKFRHPDTGATWSGRGKAPLWLTAEEAQGKSREEFLLTTPELSTTPD